MITGFGFAAAVVSLVWLRHEMTPDSATWQILLPMALLGIGNAFIWAPTSATATRNLPMHAAGAGAGVYNATRQVGAVLGSAAIAVLMDSRLAAQGLALRPQRGRRRQPARAGCHQPVRRRRWPQAMLLPRPVLVARPRRRRARSPGRPHQQAPPTPEPPRWPRSQPRPAQL